MCCYFPQCCDKMFQQNKLGRGLKVELCHGLTWHRSHSRRNLLEHVTLYPQSSKERVLMTSFFPFIQSGTQTQGIVPSLSGWVFCLILNPLQSSPEAYLPDDYRSSKDVATKCHKYTIMNQTLLQMYSILFYCLL